MYKCKVVIFGGTTEGRKLCEYCEVNAIRALYCAATPEGVRATDFMQNIRSCVKRMDAGEMAELLSREMPELVIDATHPYAVEASRNIKEACVQKSIRLIRVGRGRESHSLKGCIYFSNIENLTGWLEKTTGVIFSTLGFSAAKSFARLTDYQNRVWLRILPVIDSLRTCLELGYRSNRLICMQGPFSEELNYSMFKSVNAEILVTKNSGGTGGFAEKIKAAKNLGMRIAVLSIPGSDGTENGVLLETALEYMRGFLT